MRVIVDVINGSGISEHQAWLKQNCRGKFKWWGDKSDGIITELIPKFTILIEVSNILDDMFDVRWTSPYHYLRVTDFQLEEDAGRYIEHWTDMSKDEYYANHTARLNTIIGDQSVFWQKIKRARREFLESMETDQRLVGRDFIYWLNEKYGIKLAQDESGRINTFYEVTNELKQLVFEIKFGSD